MDPSLCQIKKKLRVLEKKCFDTGQSFDFAVLILLFNRYRWDKVESDSDSSDANENSDILAGIDDLPPGLHLPRLYHITSFIISSLLGNGLGPEFGLFSLFRSDKNQLYHRFQILMIKLIL